LGVLGGAGIAFALAMVVRFGPDGAAPGGPRAILCPWHDCGEAGGIESHRERARRAAEGLEGARLWFIQGGVLGGAEVWLLAHLQCRRRDAALDALTRSWRERLRGSTRILHPSTPGSSIGSGSGRDSYLADVLDSMGDPEEEAFEALRRLAERELDGYGLTHQLLALLWWEELGRRLPPDLANRRPALLARVRSEQASDPQFSDLYAERALVATLFGNELCPAELPSWTDAVLEAQEPSGAWIDPQDREFDGPVEPSAHTSILALGVVQAYLDCVAPERHPLGPFVPWRGVCGVRGPWPEP
jgi:hypothetical protein